MTSEHSDRANGDSYFTVEDLLEISELLGLSARKAHDQEEVYRLFKITRSIDKEIEYIQSIKGASNACDTKE